MSLGFEGPLHPAGARVPVEDLGPQGIVLECGGPEHIGRGHHRSEYTWILWGIIYLTTSDIEFLAVA